MGTQHSLELGRRIKTSQDSTLRMSSGFRIVNPYDDAGELSVSAKVESSADAGAQLGRQMLNSLSFLSTQKGLLENVSSILSKALDLRSSYNNPVMTEKDKNGYDEAFRELQKELNQISRQKFNDVSIFSTQLPGELIGDSVGLDKITQQSDALNTSDNIGVSRWGIFRDLSVNLETGPQLPEESETDGPRDLLVFALTDESIGGSSYVNSWNVEKGEELFENDVHNWLDFFGTEEANLDIKIALMRVEEGSFGKQLLPDGFELPEFVELFDDPDFPRDGGAMDDPTNVNEGLENFKNAFLSITNAGKQLPRGLAIFVDNTGSMTYDEVDSASQNFMEWIRVNYSEVAIHPVSKNSGQWNQGVYFNSSERWIDQSLIAIKDLLIDPDFPVSYDPLDEDKSGVKGLLDDTYSLKDFSVDELEVFLERVSDGLAQNGAETQAARFAIDEIANLSALRSQAASRSIDTDYSTESTRLIKSQFLIEGGAVLLNKFKNLTATALTVLGA